MKTALASLCVLALTWPAVGRAQDAGTTTGALDGSDFTLQLARDDRMVLDADALQTYFGAARCACPTNLIADLTLSTAGRDKLGGDSLDVALVVGSDCDNPAATGCVEVGAALTLSATKLESSDTIATTTIFDAAASGAACSALPSRSTRLWAIVRLGGERVASPPSLTLKIGGAAPVAPTAVTVEMADSGLRVSWKAGSTTDELDGYQVLCSPGPATPPKPAFETCAGAAPGGGSGPFATLDESVICSDLVSSGTSALVHGLENGRTYAVAVIAVGKGGTPSAPSKVVEGAPGPTFGFDDLYKESGGTAQAGCGIGGGAPGAGQAAPVLLILVMLGLARGPARTRRRPRAGRLARLTLAGLALAATPARASEIDLSTEHVPVVSPRRWTLELRFGPYRPDVDSEFSDRGQDARPFAQTFSSKRHLMSQLEVERHVLHRGGTLAVGMGVGYYRVSARSLAADHQTRTGDETALRLIPLSASLVYRADRLHDTSGFPFVPYAKAGLDWVPWSISNTAKPEDTSGSTLGWHAAAGVTLMLDFFDPEAARTLDQEAGVNGAGLFFEVAHLAWNGLGGGSQLHVGDTTWVAGLMLDL